MTIYIKAYKYLLTIIFTCFMSTCLDISYITVYVLYFDNNKRFLAVKVVVWSVLLSARNSEKKHPTEWFEI